MYDILLYELQENSTGDGYCVKFWEQVRTLCYKKIFFGTLLGMFKNYKLPYVLGDFKCTGWVSSLVKEIWGAVLDARPEFGSSANGSKVDPTLQTKLHKKCVSCNWTLQLLQGFNLYSLRTFGSTTII